MDSAKLLFFNRTFLYGIITHVLSDYDEQGEYLTMIMLCNDSAAPINVHIVSTNLVEQFRPLVYANIKILVDGHICSKRFSAMQCIVADRIYIK